MTTIQSNTNEVVLSAQQIVKAIEGLTSFTELFSEEYPEAGGNFKLYAYEAMQISGSFIEATTSFIEITDVHNGDHHFLAKIITTIDEDHTHGIVNGEVVSAFEVISKADSAMRKFIGQ